MGIVHHANYLRFCEEARVAWCKFKGISLNKMSADASAVFGLAVYESRVKHILPLRYDDEFEFKVQVSSVGARIIFQYKIFVSENLACVAETVHCNLDSNYKVKRINPEIKNIVEKEKWIETWL